MSQQQKNKELRGFATGEFGVGTFRVRLSGGSDASAWLDVEDNVGPERWIFDKDWPDGIVHSGHLVFEKRRSDPFTSFSGLKHWVETDGDADYDNDGLFSCGREHTVFNVPLPAPAQGAVEAGLGTFRVRINGDVVAWLSIAADRTERWIALKDRPESWEEKGVLSPEFFPIIDSAVDESIAACFEEALVNQAFPTFEALRWWIVHSVPQSHWSGKNLDPSARHHMVTDVPLDSV